MITWKGDGEENGTEGWIKKMGSEWQKNGFEKGGEEKREGKENCMVILIDGQITVWLTNL